MMNVLFFGTYDEQAHPRTRVLREGFESHGDVVQALNVSLGVSTAERVALLSRPARLPTLALQILQCWIRLTALRVFRRPQPDMVVVGYLGHFDVLLARLLFPNAAITLDYLVSAADTARDRRHTSSWLLTALRILDRMACAAASIVLIDTDENRPTVPVRARHKAIATPVGAPSSWFGEPAPSPDGPLKVVFFGLFTPLQGAPVVAEAVQMAIDGGADLRATLIGTGQDYDEARRRAPSSNITWQDWVPATRLPRTVQEHEVCLGIFGTTDKAKRVVPNKAYQGVAAGCLVVTSDTPPQRLWLPPETVFVPPGDARALADVLIELTKSPSLLEQRRRSWMHACETLAPERVVQKLRSHHLDTRAPNTRIGEATEQSWP